MSIMRGTYELGPQNAKLIVDTRRSGAAAKAGHDLTMEVTAWNGTLELGESPNDVSVRLHADGSSLRVLEGRGGMQSLDDGDKQNIEQTIDDDVLKSTAIDFRSSAVEADPDGSRLRVRGELEFAGQTNPIGFELALGDDGHLAGTATVTQSDWGIKPYSALFGALKVADEVAVTIDATLAG
jgi:polyisoprenoid-binding protein YceI